MNNIKIEPLFESIVPFFVNCERCFDTGIWLTPANEIHRCPELTLGNEHLEPNEASKMVNRSARRLKNIGHYIPVFEFELARILTFYTKEDPCKREKIDLFFYQDTNLKVNDIERAVKKLIENLRKIWLLPVGSSKAKPYGYWIINNLKEYKDWYKVVTSAPITQLSTIHKNAKHNFPHFAEQIEIDFWRDDDADI